MGRNFDDYPDFQISSKKLGVCNNTYRVCVRKMFSHLEVTVYIIPLVLIDKKRITSASTWLVNKKQVSPNLSDMSSPLTSLFHKITQYSWVSSGPRLKSQLVTSGWSNVFLFIKEWRKIRNNKYYNDSKTNNEKNFLSYQIFLIVIVCQKKNHRNMIIWVSGLETLKTKANVWIKIVFSAYEFHDNIP